MAAPVADYYGCVSGGVVAGGRRIYPSWLSAMGSRTWVKVGGVANTIDPEDNPSINPNYPADAPWHGTNGFYHIMAAWSGAAYNELRDELEVMGGGHGNYAGNERLRIALNVESPAWELVTHPTGGIGNTGTLNDGQETTGVYFDGNPRSGHTYNNILFIGDSLHIAMNGALYYNGQGSSASFVGDRLGTWTQLASKVPALTDNEGGACYDPTRDRIYYFQLGNQQISYHDMAADTWGLTGKWHESSGAKRPIYIADHDIIVVLATGYTRGFGVFDFGRTTSASIPQPPISGTNAVTAQASGVWVQELGCIVLWNGGTGFDTLTPPATNQTTNTWTWGRIEADAGNTVTPDTPISYGTFGRFFYSPTLHILGCVNGTANQLNIFKL